MTNLMVRILGKCVPKSRRGLSVILIPLAVLGGILPGCVLDWTVDNEDFCDLNPPTELATCEETDDCKDNETCEPIGNMRRCVSTWCGINTPATTGDVPTTAGGNTTAATETGNPNPLGSGSSTTDTDDPPGTDTDTDPTTDPTDTDEELPEICFLSDRELVVQLGHPNCGADEILTCPGLEALEKAEEVEAALGHCGKASYLSVGDAVCDDGTAGSPDYDCSAYGRDCGACPALD